MTGGWAGNHPFGFVFTSPQSCAPARMIWRRSSCDQQGKFLLWSTFHAHAARKIFALLH
jgi:hypothetical protein